MEGAAKLFVVASVALLGCRAVLGIEDIDEAADAGQCTGKAGDECATCCRDSNPSGNDELETKLAPCICDGGSGASDCATTVSCGGMKPGVCPKERDDCLKSPACKAVYDCLAACK